MKTIQPYCIVAVLAFWLMGCAVVSEQAQQEALPQMPFPKLVDNAEQNIGQTVIMGGYIVDVENRRDRTIITAVQAPLGVGQEPKSKDRSQGRLILIYPSFLDPQVYTEGRKITVAGKLLGSSQTEKEGKPFPYLRVEVSEIHLWPVQAPRYVDPYYWDPWWWGPYPYSYLHPFGWRHPYYWR